MIVTGGNTGIGLPTAVELAKAGAHVLIACRDAKRGEEAVASIKAQSGKGDKARVETVALDLADLESVRAFVREIKKRNFSVDRLILNAGVMRTPFDVKTKQGFEMQFGNHSAPCCAVL